MESVNDLNVATKLRIVMAQGGLEVGLNVFTVIEITDECLRNAQYHHHHHHHRRRHRQQQQE